MLDDKCRAGRDAGTRYMRGISAGKGVIRRLGLIVGYDGLTGSRFVPCCRPVILTYRQKLRPTRAQHRLLDERLERQRQLYNGALQEAVSPVTPTWAVAPCVVPEPSPLPSGSAGDETSGGVSNPK